MKNLKLIGQALVIALGLLIFPVISLATATHTLQFVQTPTTTLYSSMSGAATTMRITPYPKDLDGTKLTISDFGSSPTLTVDPKVKNIEEIVGFTAITDNGDNTATLSGLSRDLVSKYPYTTTGSGRSHTAGALVVFSNNPQMYARLASWENDGTITGLWAFTTSPTAPVPTTSTQVATKGYADALVIAGGVAASFSVPGISILATGLNAASSTASTTYSGIDYGNVLTAKIATSSPGNLCGLCIPVSQNSGKLSQSWTDLTSAFSWSGLHTFTAGLLTTASSTMNATTTIAASSVTNKALVLNTIPYSFPSSGLASSTTWGFDITGKATFVPLATTTTGTLSVASNSGANTISLAFPAAPRMIKMKWTYIPSGNNVIFQLTGEGTYNVQTGTYSEIYSSNSGASGGGSTATVSADSSAIVSGSAANNLGTFAGAISAVSATGFTLTMTNATGATPTVKILWSAEI